MAEPFLGEIRIMGFGWPPKTWALCNGQKMPINQNQALFSLLGTTFGGDGRVDFALPNLQGRVPIHAGDGFPLGAIGGEPSHTVTIGELPQHTHVQQATSTQADADTGNVTDAGALLAASVGQNLYGPPTNLTAMAPQNVSNVGGSQAHNNMQPYLVLNFCIALQGIFPSPN